MRKQVVITMCFLNGKKERERIHAPRGKAFTKQGIENILNAQATYVEKAFPGREFSFVPLRDGNFNFVECLPRETEGAPAAVSA